MKKQSWSLFHHSTNEDYLCLFGIYIHKRILKLVLFVLLLIPVGALIYALVETYHLTTLNEREKITYRYDDPRLNYIEGYVIIVNEQDEMVYEGQFAKGKCNGQGTVYQNGKKRYVGKLVDNAYEDDKGKLYDAENRLVYEGGFVKGMYEGEGFLYYPSGTYRAQGTFAHGELNGMGIEYSEDETILREGEYLYGRLNGHGISYYEGTNIRQYEGEFMGNSPIGEGTLYTGSGRVWYHGFVYEYEPDYESLIGATFEEIRTHFFDPILCVTTEHDSALIIPKRQVAFVSDLSYEHIKGKEKQPTNTMDATVSSIDESTYFIQAIVLLRDAMTLEEQQLYDEEVVEGSYVYHLETNNLSSLDLYAMILSKEQFDVTPFDALIKTKEETKRLKQLEFTIPQLYLDRYVLEYHGVSLQTTMLDEEGRWCYQILSEQKEVSE